MIANKVKKIMSGSILRLAKKEGVNPTEICMFIHSKQEDCSPQYFYTVQGKVKKDDEGRMINLDFKKDILNVKLDMLGQEYISSTFLKGYIKNVAIEHKINSMNTYIQIATASETAQELHLALLENGTKLKNLTLDDIFSD